jgi:hypothetical protein
MWVSGSLIQERDHCHKIHAYNVESMIARMVARIDAMTGSWWKWCLLSTMITVDTTCSSEGNSSSALTLDDDVLSSEEKIVGGKQFFPTMGSMHHISPSFYLQLRRIDRRHKILRRAVKEVFFSINSLIFIFLDEGNIISSGMKQKVPASIPEHSASLNFYLETDLEEFLKKL